MIPSWLTIRAASEYCCVSPNTVRSWLRDGLCHSRVSRGLILIQREDIDEFLRGFMEDSETHQKQVDAIVGDVMRGL